MSLNSNVRQELSKEVFDLFGTLLSRMQNTDIPLSKSNEIGGNVTSGTSEIHTVSPYSALDRLNVHMALHAPRYKAVPCKANDT